jgi:hypothetical protein
VFEILTNSNTVLSLDNNHASLFPLCVLCDAIKFLFFCFLLQYSRQDFKRYALATSVLSQSRGRKEVQREVRVLLQKPLPKQTHSMLCLFACTNQL